MGTKAGEAPPLRVVPVGRRLALPTAAGPAELYLMTAVERPGMLALTMALHPPATHGDQLASAPLRGTKLIADQFTATDDRDVAYRIGFSGVAGPAGWDGYLDAYPEPAAGAQWLDLATEADGPRLRISLAGAADVATVAEAAPGPDEDNLLAAPAGRPVTRTAAAPLAAVLPEVDGARFALAGLITGPAGSLLHVVAMGLAAPSGDVPVLDGLDQRFAWRLRTGGPGGRWHAAAARGYELGLHDEVRLRLGVDPVLSPDDGDLEVAVTGPKTRMRARVPVAWHALSWPGR